MKRETPAIATAIDNGILTITVMGHTPIIVDPTTLPDNVVQYAALHGLKQKLGDAAALSVENGIRPTPAMKHTAIMEVWTSVQSGVWNRRAEGDGSSSDGLLVRAVAEVTGQTTETAREFIAGLTKPEQSAMRLDPTIAPVILRMKTEKAPKVDTAAKLAMLRNIGKGA